MLHVIFTLDYEIHGNGEGSPRKLMVEPTDRMLHFFDEYGAKLTIMADVAEILKFEEYAQEFGRDDFHYQEIARQLRDTVRRGHDVQLHLHSSYSKATCADNRWHQNWSEYDFAGLSLDRMNELVRGGKDFLESLLVPVTGDYRCIAFRAANWSVSPSQNVVQALTQNGIKIDTSVFKYGRRSGMVSFDYSHAPSELVPWRADPLDICRSSDSGTLSEFPIYSERRWIGAFVSLNRIYRSVLSRRHKFPADLPNGNGKSGAGARRQPGSASFAWFFRKHAWKADFNQCSGSQLIAALNRAEAKYSVEKPHLPFVLIGHSKLFTRLNQASLRPFLAYVAANPSRFAFGTFSSFEKKSGTYSKPEGINSLPRLRDRCGQPTQGSCQTATCPE